MKDKHKLHGYFIFIIGTNILKSAQFINIIFLLLLSTNIIKNTFLAQIAYYFEMDSLRLIRFFTEKLAAKSRQKLQDI